MSQIFGSLERFKDVLKIRIDNVKIENTIFRLFSKVTVGILCLSGGWVTLQQLIGNHIECILPPEEDIREETLNQYCFIMSTYTLPHLYNQTVGKEVSHFGVGRYDPTKDKQKYHSYYQWVPLVLFLQCVLFWLPHCIWKAYEGGRIKAYCDLEVVPMVSLKSRSFNSRISKNQRYGAADREEATKINRASLYFVENIGYNFWYSYMHIFCEILNFVMVLSNIFLTDAFLGYEFSTCGKRALHLFGGPETRPDAMENVFPKVTKCDFQKYGPSGSIIRYDIMCVLGLNSINEKIYVFLWVWFMFLSTMGGLNIIYRFLALSVAKIRSFSISFCKKLSKQQEEDLKIILKKLKYSDWFVLKRVSANLSAVRFGELCAEIVNIMTAKNIIQR